MYFHRSLDSRGRRERFLKRTSITILHCAKHKSPCAHESQYEPDQHHFFFPLVDSAHYCYIIILLHRTPARNSPVQLFRTARILAATSYNKPQLPHTINACIIIIRVCINSVQYASCFRTMRPFITCNISQNVYSNIE